jgi:hypothetical protein
MRLPPAVFESALRDAEARSPFIGTGEVAFLAAMREECKRRGWVQVDLADHESWSFHDVPGFDNHAGFESGPVFKPK